MMKIFKRTAAFLTAVLLASSCTKYQDIQKSDYYPEQTVYLPAAVDGVSLDGIYTISNVAVPGQVFRYVADVPGKKLNIPLSVYRAGINNNGSIQVSIVPDTDTVNRFLAAGKFPAGTALLAADKYALDNSVTIQDGSETGDFTLSVDLDFLLANLTTKYALGVSITADGKATGERSTVIVLIDPAFLVPAANFTTTVSNRTVDFSNTSVNAIMYSWDYGDGTPLSTEKAASHTYEAGGTYTVTLTAKGALGDMNKAVYSSDVVIP